MPDRDLGQPHCLRALGLGCVALILALGMALFVHLYRYPAWDFRNNLWGPARLLVSGEAPHDPTALDTLAASWGVPFHQSIWFPTIVGTGLPFGLLPLPSAANLWLLISLGATLFSVLIVHRTAVPSGKHRSLVPVALAVAFCAPLYAHLNQGQAALWVLASVMGSWALMSWDRAVWAGVALSLSWAKPQLVVLAWPLLGLTALKRGQARSLLLGWLAGTLAQTLPLWILEPGWLAGYLSALRANPAWVQPNLRSLASLAFGSAGVGWLVSLLLLAGATGWLVGLWRRSSGISALSWALGLTPVLSPFSWSYDQVLMLPLLIVALLSSRPALQRAAGWSVLVLAQVAYLVLRMQTRSDAWYAWYPPILLLLSAWLAPPRRLAAEHARYGFASSMD